MIACYAVRLGVSSATVTLELSTATNRNLAHHWVTAGSGVLHEHNSRSSHSPKQADDLSMKHISAPIATNQMACVIELASIQASVAPI